MSVREMIAKLISFPTVSRDSNLTLINFVRDYLHSHGITSQLVPNDEGTKANLYATIGPMAPGGVILSGHTDVVPVDGQAWTSDPFTVTERDGKLFGRGACDMKSFAAIILALLPEMKQLRKPIHLALSYDEEVGCIGAPRMIRELVRHLPQPRAVIVGEPTNMQVVTAHKGMMMLKTTVTGHEAHSSQTHRGVSAVMHGAKLIDFLAELAQRKQAAAALDSGFEPNFTTIHVGTVKGGTAVNIISRHCEFGWDIRNIPDDDPHNIIEEFTAYCRDALAPAMQAIAPNTGIETAILSETPGLRHDPDSAAVQLAQSLSGENATHKVSYAAEGGQFQEAGLPTVLCGPGSIDQAHKPDEFITLEQIELGAAFIRKLVERLSRD